jgi:hypothetical protein
MTTEEVKKQYNSITSLYDLAEELASTVENKLVKNPEDQLDLIEPLINEVADATDILTEEYINIMEDTKHHKTAKVKIEKALRQIFMALENYRNRVKELTDEKLSTLAGLANPIVNKIYKQVEKIMLIFMQLIELSLDRIMRKHELDEFKLNNEHFISMLPQHSH